MSKWQILFIRADNGKANGRNIGGALFGRTMASGNRHESSICSKPIVRVHRDGPIHTGERRGRFVSATTAGRFESTHGRTIVFSDSHETNGKHFVSDERDAVGDAESRCTGKIKDGTRRRADNGRMTKNRPERTDPGAHSGGGRG